jgi:hypothetical protein
VTIHVVLPPRRVPQSGCWYTECICGETAVGGTEQEARDGIAVCRTAADAAAPPPRRTVRTGRRR